MDAVNNNMNSALHLAVLDGFRETAEYLIDAGAETSVANRAGDTVLGICVEKFPELASRILDKRRKEQDGPALFGDSISVRYDFTAIDDNRTAIPREAVVVRGYGLVHPQSKHASSQVVETVKMLERKGSARNMIVGSGETPLRRMAQLSHRDLISHPVIIKLLESKWDLFAKRVFIREFLLQLVLLILWILGTVGWGAAVEVQPYLAYNLDQPFMNMGGWLNAIMFWLFFVICFVMLLRELGPILRLGHPLKELRNRDIWWWYDVVTFTFVLTVVVAAHVVSFSSNSLVDPYKTLPRAALSLGSLLLWVRFMQFLAAHRVTGPFVKIMSNMILDMVNFTLVYCVLLFGFAHAFFLVMTSSFFTDDSSSSSSSSDTATTTTTSSVRVRSDGMLHDFSLRKMPRVASDQNPFQKFSQTILATFQLLVGDFAFSNFEGSASISLVTVLYLLYTCLSTILMLNLLIAMFNETYAKIKYDSTREWRLEWAKRILKIQSRVQHRRCCVVDFIQVDEPAEKPIKTAEQLLQDSIENINSSLQSLSTRMTNFEQDSIKLNQKMDLMLSRIARSQLNAAATSSNQASPRGHIQAIAGGGGSSGSNTKVPFLRTDSITATRRYSELPVHQLNLPGAVLDQDAIIKTPNKHRDA